MISTALIRLLAIGLLALSTALPASAAMVGTAQLQPGAAEIAPAGLAAQRDWIREQLIAGGVDAALAGQRVAAMTDAQVVALQRRIDDMPAGGADGLLIIILILVITELMGYTDIVPGWPAR